MPALIAAAALLAVGAALAALLPTPRAQAWAAVATQALAAASAALCAAPVLLGSTEAPLSPPGALFLVFSLLLTLLATVEGLVCTEADALSRAAATRQFAGLNTIALALAGFYASTSGAGLLGAGGFGALGAWLLTTAAGRKTVVARRRGALAHGLGAQALVFLVLRLVASGAAPSPAVAWAALGVSSALACAGALLARTGSDLDRLCTGSAATHIGLAGIGLAAGLLGLATRDAELAALGIAGALLHVINLSIFGGLLSAAANAVVHATGSPRYASGGGLLRELPWGGVSFLVGALAASCLPPLNGFVSAFLIVAALVDGPAGRSLPLLAAAAAIALALALNGRALLLAFGQVFLLGKTPPVPGHSRHGIRARGRPLPTAAYIVAASILGALPSAALGLVVWPMRSVCLDAGVAGAAPLGNMLAILAPVSAVTGGLVAGFMALAFTRSVALP